MRKTLAGLVPEEIVEACAFRERFRGLQVFSRIVKGARSVTDLTDLSAAERERIDGIASVHACSVEEELVSQDGTAKLKLRLHDGHSVECVLLIDAEGRKTACLSCQVGCPLGCAFCMTGTLGFARNLTVSEIADQFLFLAGKYGKISNIVYMGMGEPTLNPEAVYASAKWFMHRDGFNVSRRKITLSTAGNAQGIRQLADSGLGIRLAVSLTVADQEAREILMPIAKTNPLKELKSAIGYYQEKTGERVTLEAAIMGGSNDTVEDARKLASFAEGLDVQANVIPWNPVPGLPFKEPSRNRITAFEAELERLGVNVSRRAKRGRGVSGACGQLGEVKARNDL